MPVASPPEPKVLTEDIRRILELVIQPDLEDAGESVARVAEDAETSTRTVYRVLRGEMYSVGLDLADRLVMAAGGHLSDCRIVREDGTVVEYLA